MDRKVTGDASPIEPVLESELDLASAQVTTATSGEERVVRSKTRGPDARLQKPADSRREVDGLSGAALAIDLRAPLAEVDIAYLQPDCRPQPHAGLEQEGE
jgi:hypothetical protein